jgi:hypothetical protein
VRLPRADAVEIDIRKVRDYLLSAKHPVGRHKARFFASLGFTGASVPEFIAEIRRIASTETVVSVDDTGFARKYTVGGELKGPLGTAAIETVWIEERGKSFVRLVTVLPRSS